jgi:DinB family protein
MHDPLTELATVPTTPLHPAVLAARTPLASVVANLLAVPDGKLENPWRWRPTDPDDVELRYGFYRIHERLEAAVTAITLGRADGSGPKSNATIGPAAAAIGPAAAAAAAIGPAVVATGTGSGPAIPPLAAMAAARWELQGLLAPLSDADWDADPGGGGWTIRQTLGHIISGQRLYGWYNAWFLSRPAIDTHAAYPPDGTMPPEPPEADEAAGTPDEVRARLDEVVDSNISASAGLDRAAMRVGARWSGLPVTIDFRLGRYGSHIREHTVQVDKTLVMLGRQPSEVERLVRLILATYGRLEALIVGRPVDLLDQALADGSTTASILGAAMDDVVAVAAHVRATAEA